MVLTLHDAIDRAEAAGRRLRGHYRSRFHQWVARTRADRILTISEHSRGDLTRYHGVPASKIVVTPLAADRRFFEPPTDQARARARPWSAEMALTCSTSAVGKGARTSLSCSGASPRPGSRGSRSSWPAARTASVRAGSVDTRHGHQRPRPDPRVRPRRRPPVSLRGGPGVRLSEPYEGFGLQVCEAMAAGCPTVAARATSLPEVLGDGGVTFPIDGPTPLAALIRRVAADPAFRADLAARARDRAPAFSWRKTAELTSVVYRSLVADLEPSRSRRPTCPAIPSVIVRMAGNVPRVDGTGVKACNSPQP